MLAPVIQSLAQFEQALAPLLLNLELDPNDYPIDHICLRSASITTSRQLEQALLTVGTLLSRAKVNGRPIVIIKLDNGLKLFNQSVDVIELPYPKANQKETPYLWQHIEFVLPSQATTPEGLKREHSSLFEVLEAKAQAKGIKVKYSAPTAEGEQLANPTIAFDWAGLSIKFHPHPLESVVTAV